MARRSDHSREELKELILDSAADIVKQEGLAALTARRVADAIGYSPGTLYNLFANLDDLVLHLNGRTLDHLRDDLANVPLSGNAKADTGALAAAYLRYLEKQPALWQLLFDHKLPDGAELPAWYAEHIGQTLSILERALAPAYVNNTAGAENAARILWASLHGICSLASSGKLPVVSSQTVTEMVTTLGENFIAGVIANKAGD